MKTVESVESAKSNQKCKRTYNFCGKQGHFVQDCRTVSKYTWKGKCMRLGKKIVLMSGSFVLADVEGATLMECIDQYYKDKPTTTVGTIDVANVRLNASEGERHKAVLGVEVEKKQDAMRTDEVTRAETSTEQQVKVGSKQSNKLSKIIKQVLECMMDRTVSLTH